MFNFFNFLTHTSTKDKLIKVLVCYPRGDAHVNMIFFQKFTNSGLPSSTRRRMIQCHGHHEEVEHKALFFNPQNRGLARGRMKSTDLNAASSRNIDLILSLLFSMKLKASESLRDVCRFLFPLIVVC